MYEKYEPHPIKFKDFLILSKANMRNNFPAGEFPNVFDIFSESKHSLESESEPSTSRIYNFIEDLIKKNISGLEENFIERILTNEFFFYTKEPLTLEQFQELMGKLMNLAQMQPQNVHLILGSFAVLTPEGKIMNVVPFIRCGKNATIDLIVKKNTAAYDPSYSYQDKDETEKYYDYIKSDEKISEIAITINNKKNYFSFNNTFECHDNHDNEFYCCIEVCIDHTQGLANKELIDKIRKNINRMLSKKDFDQKEIIRYCSHIIISNTTPVCTLNVIGSILHVDPKHGPKNDYRKALDIDTPSFGPPSQLIESDSIGCEKLPQMILELAELHNNILSSLLKNKTIGSDELAMFLSKCFQSDYHSLIWFLDGDNEESSIFVINNIMKLQSFLAEKPKLIYDQSKNIRKLFLEFCSDFETSFYNSPAARFLRQEVIFHSLRMKTDQLYIRCMQTCIENKLAIDNRQGIVLDIMKNNPFFENDKEFNNLLFLCIILNDDHSLRELLEKGYDFCKKCELNELYCDRYTPYFFSMIFPEKKLHYVFEDAINKQLFDEIQNNNQDNILRLLKEGANLNYMDSRSGETVFTNFIKNMTVNSSLDVLKFLLENGADFNKKNKYNQSSLDIAKNLGLKDVSKVFKEINRKNHPLTSTPEMLFNQNIQSNTMDNTPTGQIDFNFKDK
ncbi:MAG: hypothetical protein HYX60_11650 [Legionella longbeachae]|nr:hypothetical protein [Legionella longbeachae]